jgi:hypothetical protein
MPEDLNMRDDITNSDNFFESIELNELEDNSLMEEEDQKELEKKLGILAYVEDLEKVMWVTNIEKLGFVDKSIQEIMDGIEDVEIRMNLFMFHSQFISGQFSYYVDSILRKEKNQLTEFHIEIKNHLERNLERIIIVIDSLTIKGQFRIIHKLFKFLENLGYSNFKFIPNFLKKLTIFAKFKDLKEIEELEELMDYLIEEMRLDNDYLFYLYQLSLKQLKKHSHEVLNSYTRGMNFRTVIKRLNFIYEDDTTVLERFEETFNFPSFGEDFCVTQALEEPFFRKRWTQRNWFYHTSLLDFTQEMPMIESEEMLIINELNYMVSLFELSYQEVLQFNFYNLIMSRIYIRINEETNPDLQLRLSFFLSHYFKLLTYSGLGGYYKMRTLGYSESQLMQNCMNTLFVKIVSKDNFDSFVLGNLYMFHALISNINFFNFDIKLISSMFNEMIKAPFNLLNFQDQVTFLQVIVRAMNFLDPSDFGSNKTLLRRYMLAFLLLPEKLFSLYNDRQAYLWILNFFPDDSEIFQAIIQNLPSDVDLLENPLKKFTINHFLFMHKMHQNHAYMLNSNILFKMIESSGHAHLLQNINLKNIQRYLNIYCMVEMHGLKEESSTELVSNINLREYNSFDDDDIRQFGEEVAPYFKPATKEIKTQNIMRMLLTPDIKAQLEEELQVE